MFSLNRPARTVFLAMALGITGLPGCGTGEKAAPQSAPSMPAREVTVVTLTPQEITLTRELPGRTRASLIAEVRPQVSGIIEERLFSEGGQVKAGQPLYQLEDAVYRADFNRTKAAVARAKAMLEAARRSARRTSELVKAGAVSQQDHDNAQAALEQAEADLKVAQAEVDSATVTLEYSTITSPISGYIGRSSVTQGALVTSNQAQPLATIQQFDPIYIDLAQSSSEWLQIRKDLAAGTLKKADNLQVTILLEDGSRYQHQGALAFSEMTVDPTTGSYSLRVEVPNPDRFLMPGMYVRAVIGSGVRQQALLVPQQAIMRDPKGNTTAMVVDADNKVEMRAVQVSRAVGNKWLVEGGLAEGDRVIIEGLQKIRPGMPVEVTESSTPTVIATTGN